MRKPREQLSAFLARVHVDAKGPRITDIAVADLGEVTYSSPGADKALENSSVGWTLAYGAGWDRVFGGKAREMN